MADNVHYLTPRQTEIGHFIRIGHSSFRILENLHAAGRLPIKRAVTDASHIRKQSDLINCLKSSGSELVLDLKAAELSFEGDFESSAKNLPWAHKDRPHLPTDFNQRKIVAFCEQIVEFAIDHQVNVIHCATHLIISAKDPWLKIDADICNKLRSVLDRYGGQQIQIDYPLIVTYRLFRDENECNAIIERLIDLPFTNLWLRVSGFGGMTTATPAGLSRYIHSSWLFQSLGKAISLME